MASTTILSKDKKKKAVIFETVLGFEVNIYMRKGERYESTGTKLYETFDLAAKYVKTIIVNE